MCKATGLLAMCLMSSIGHADNFAKAPAPPVSKPPAPQMLDPIQVDSLSLTPIVADPDASAPDLLVLDEAMPKKLVRIREHEGGDVNQLELVNRSKQPVFLLAGEVIIGGKQDRIIGRNTVIPASSSQQVPVFCVEHGRWTEQSKEFTTAKALAHGRLRGNASFEEQGAVWDEVHAKNEARKTANNTDTYRKVAAQQSDGTLAKMEKRVDAALDKLPAEQRARLVGFAVALNGKVATVDVFQSHALFTKLEGKLVRSYLTEAVDLAAEKDAKPPTAAAITTFMDDADKATAEQSYDTKAAKTYVSKGKHADSAKVMYDANPAAAPVYKTYQDKK